jgi:shikimate kinase
MNNIKRIYILGQPGAGKALLAKTLADRLGWSFVDADFGLEFKIGLEINAILGKSGNDSFQMCQSQLINKLAKEEKIVIATDCSIVDSDKCRQLLLSEFTVFVDVSLPTQMERNARNPSLFLSQSDTKDLLDLLHKKRDFLFKEICDISINSDDSDLEKHVEVITKFLIENHNVEINDTDISVSDKNSILFHKTSHTPVKLTPQQTLCVKLLVDGMQAKEIARKLNISFRTVEAHIAKSMEITGCSNSKELIALFLS